MIGLSMSKMENLNLIINGQTFSMSKVWRLGDGTENKMKEDYLT
jgi:hypothetical protein